MIEQVILQYTSIVSNQQNNVKYATTSSKFEFDIKNMLNAGYKSVSFADFCKNRNTLNGSTDRIFSIVFIGGYLDNYNNAFEIIKQYNINVAIFVATDLVGLNSYPGIENFIPHFGWEEAQIMIDSGLINIYPLWHNFDINKNFNMEIQKKVKLLNEKLTNNGNIIAISGCTPEQLLDAKQYGINILLCNFDTYIANNPNNDLVPMICVNYDEEALDILEQYIDLFNYSFRSKSIEKEDKYQNTLSASTVILPIDLNPIARNYLHISTPLSVIGAKRKDKLERQVANQLIDVIFKPQYNLFDYHCDSYENWECLDCKSISKDILNVNGISVVNYIINGLHLGYYCDIWLDVFYIPGKVGYNKEHFSHGLLVYGYDSNRSIFHTLSYNANGLYHNIDVAMTNFQKACSNEFLSKICLLKYKPGINAKYSKETICKKLSNYINSYHYDVETSFNKNTSEQYVQYDACLKFCEYIESILHNDCTIHNTAMYSYTEHKRIMAWRIQYLMEREHLVSEELMNMSTNISSLSEQLLNLSLKYNITKNKKCHSRIIDMINTLNHLEKNLIETFLSLQL